MIFNYGFSVLSRFRQELMGIAILGVCLLHAFDWAGIGDSVISKAISPFARIAFTEGFLFLSGFGLYYSFSKNSDLRQFYLKRVNRVLLPYMIMGLPFFLLTWQLNSWLHMLLYPYIGRFLFSYNLHLSWFAKLLKISDLTNFL